MGGGAVDPALQLAVLRGDAAGVSLLGGGLQAPHHRPDRGAVPEVLKALPRRKPDPLLLLSDVRHREKPRRGGATIVATG